ncbi:pentatricopeptide repeat-containing protein At1g19720-like [Aristolochia californica]|uniref:pentatricopeptide repeat-containing protein At1g19720-like n=1 Tax=Aristolochia californica TaxID=171875 RepID=UPI0035DFD5B1
MDLYLIELCRNGQLKEVLLALESLAQSRCSMISGFDQNNRKHQALYLSGEMLLVGIEPNGMTVASALEAAKRVFYDISDKDIFTWNSMIGGYCKPGLCRNMVTWNVLISGYMQNGDEDQAMELFHATQGFDSIWSNAIFDCLPFTDLMNSMVSGYVLHGQPNSVIDLFDRMTKEGINRRLPNFAGLETSVELLGRSGRLKEATGFIEKMPNFGVWATMLTACMMHSNVSLAINAAEDLLSNWNQELVYFIICWYRCMI